MSERPQYVDLMNDLVDQVGSALSPAGMEAASIYQIAAVREEMFCYKTNRVREAFNTFIGDRSELNLRELKREISALAMAAEMSRLSRRS